MSQHPEQYGHRPPYRGEWPDQEESATGYPDPQVRPVSGVTDAARSRGTVYGSAAVRYGHPESGYARPDSAGGPADPPRRRGRAPLVAGLVTVLLVGAGGAGYAWHRSRSSGTGDAANVSQVGTASANPSGVVRTSGGVAASGKPSAPPVLAPTAAARDSGVVLCAQMRDSNGKPVVPSASARAGGGVDANTAKYRYLRKQFADSRYADIRQAGTRFLDTFWLMPTPTITDAVQIAKDFAAKTVEVYTALSKACANHGVKLPPITGG